MRIMTSTTSDARPSKVDGLLKNVLIFAIPALIALGLYFWFVHGEMMIALIHFALAAVDGALAWSFLRRRKPSPVEG